MSVAKSAMRFLGVQATPVIPTVSSKAAPCRREVMERAARSVTKVQDLLGCVTKELVEGDLELADLVVPKR